MKNTVLMAQIEAALKAGGYFKQIGISKHFSLHAADGTDLGSFNLQRYNALVLKYGTRLAKNAQWQWHLGERTRPF